jgi:hypothetical protein
MIKFLSLILIVQRNLFCGSCLYKINSFYSIPALDWYLWPPVRRKPGDSEPGDWRDGEDLEEEDESEAEGRLADSSRAGLRQELAAALAKIFQLREIIRSLELQLEARDKTLKVEP